MITFRMMSAIEGKDSILSRQPCCYCLYFSKVVFGCFLGEPYKKYIFLYPSIDCVCSHLENILVLACWYSNIENNARFFELNCKKK